MIIPLSVADKYVNLDSNIEFLGKKRYKKLTKGIKRKLMGVKIKEKNINLTKEIKLFDDNNKTIGYLRSAVYSPSLR